MKRIKKLLSMLCIMIVIFSTILQPFFSEEISAKASTLEEIQSSANVEDLSSGTESDRVVEKNFSKTTESEAVTEEESSETAESEKVTEEESSETAESEKVTEEESSETAESEKVTEEESSETTESEELEVAEENIIILPEDVAPVENPTGINKFLRSIFARSTDDEKNHLGQYAIISDAKIKVRNTGTEPFDADNNAGNDTDEQNDIVRTFDKIHYDIELTTQIKEDAVDAEGKPVTKVMGGNIQIYAKIPENVDVTWNEDSLLWVSDRVISENGKTVTGYYHMDSSQVSAPGSQTLTFDADVNACKNGATFTPEFQFYLDGNQESEYMAIKDTPITISAAPNYNLVLNWDKGTPAYKGVEMEVLGGAYKVYNVGFGFQLLGDSQEKGLRGIEFPKGDIEFDVTPTLTKLSHKDDPESGGEDITSNYVAFLTGKYNTYDFIKEELTDQTYFDVLNENIVDRTGILSTHLPSSHGAFTPVENYSGADQEVYESGKFTMTTNGNTVHVKISDYATNGIFPSRFASSSNPDDVNFTKNVGFISVGNMFFAVDTTCYDIDSTNCYLSFKANNLVANSLSNVAGVDKKDTDNELGTMHVQYDAGMISFGVYPWNVDLNDRDHHKSRLNSSFDSADARATANSVIALDTAVTLNGSAPLSMIIGGMDMLVKFDNFCEPVTYADGEQYVIYDRWINKLDNIVLTPYYAAKPDKTAWASDDERNSTRISELVYFSSLEELKAQGYYCVGILYESESGTIPRGETIHVFTPVKVKESVPDNTVYGVVQATGLWNTEQFTEGFRDQYSVKNYLGQTRADAGITYPSTMMNWRPSYQKAEYSNAQVVGGHKPGYHEGNSILIVPAITSIEKTVADLQEDGTEKKIYDLRNDETVASFTLSPSFRTDATTTITSDVVVVDKLPAGTTYIKGSSSIGDPVITEEEGIEVLTWTLTNVTVNEAIAPINYNVKIDHTLASGTVLKNTVVISSPVDTSAELVRTTASSITVVNLEGHRIYKEALKEQIYEDELVEFDLHYLNINNTSTTCKFLDILPYNGDDRGTSYNGTYTVKSLSSEITKGSTFTIYGTTKDVVGLTVDRLDVSDWERLGNAGEEINVNKALTAIAVVGDFAAYEEMIIHMSLDPEGAKKDDIYYNDFSLQTGGDSTPILSAPVYTSIISNDPPAPKKVKLTITKRILASEIYEPFGVPSFVFYIQHEDGIEDTRMIRFDKETVEQNTGEDGYVSVSVSMELKEGTYIVREVGDVRYKIQSVTAELGTVNEDKTITFKLTDGMEGKAVYQNYIENWIDLTHTSSVENFVPKKVQ